MERRSAIVVTKTDWDHTDVIAVVLVPEGVPTAQARSALNLSRSSHGSPYGFELVDCYTPQTLENVFGRLRSLEDQEKAAEQQRQAAAEKYDRRRELTDAWRRGVLTRDEYERKCQDLGLESETK